MANKSPREIIAEYARDLREGEGLDNDTLRIIVTYDTLTIHKKRGDLTPELAQIIKDIVNDIIEKGA